MRYLLRLSVLMLASVAVCVGLVFLLKAQVLLNRYAELQMASAEASPASASERISAARHELFVPSSAVEPVDMGRTPVPVSRAPRLPIVAGSERAGAIHVSDAERIADVAADDRWVDVILTRQSAPGAALPEVVLENVKVLTIERGRGDRSTLHAVTLDVDSDTVKDLLVASQSSKLSLALHRPSENRRRQEVQTGAAEVADNLQPSAPQAPQTSGPDLAEIPVQLPPQPQQSGSREVANATPAAGPDEHFTIVTIHRVGGTPTTHRVRRER